ncbi:MAG: phenylalanine--tRNA ligase subunit beta [Tatlockia sp.]|nr:phenylalanine--tRNA ligase subunit beta [Tatlockia sp.]
MKLSELWLREWINPTLDEQQLAARLTMAGLEVDAVNPVAGAFDQVIVAQVVKTLPHPQADKLTLCMVNTGKAVPLKVVCGASNVRPGLKVAFAQIGASLPHGLTIKQSTLRGELSQGMLCSATELGLTDMSDGIMELEDDAPLGMDLRDYLALNDHVLDIDLTPNRADCFSVLGVARELSALTKLPLKPSSQPRIPATIDTSLTIHLKAPEACPIYSGRIIQGINAQARTPLLISERLRRAGLRTIHPVVDVCNYVMLELGQPLHAFDLETIKGDLTVRFSQMGETIDLLDGQQIELNSKVLVIADEENPLAIAGVMGGEPSSVCEKTENIFLESAFFNPFTITGVARAFGLNSDSSQRYERGVDPSLHLIALERATELLLKIVGGKAGPISLVLEPAFIPEKKRVLFNPLKVKQLTGISIAEDEMKLMLQNLGMMVDSKDKLWLVDVPTYRFDIRLEADLIEEILRLFGYDNISGEPMIAAVQAGKINPLESLTMQVADLFTARGYQETISYSFVDPELQQELYPDKESMQLLNPISSELSQMRVGMWPGLIASMIYNIHRQQTAVKFFETGVIFDLQSGLLQEHQCLAGLITGEKGILNWSENAGKFDFYDLKGDLEALFQALKSSDVQFVAAVHSALHPGKSAEIQINGHAVGWCGVLHPRIADALDLQEEVILFELRLASLINTQAVRYQQISKFPQIQRDLSLLVDDKLNAAQIEKAVREVVNSDWLKAFDVFDVYTGDSIPKGKKSLAITLTLQDDNRTMVDSEINTVISAIIIKLNEEFSIILRD